MRLRVVTPEARPEEVAAIVAALAVLRARPEAAEAADEGLQEWVRAARLQARRTGLQRGPWRMSGRLVRRARA